MEMEEEEKSNNATELTNCNEENWTIDEFFNTNSADNSYCDSVPVPHNVVGRQIVNFTYFFEQIKPLMKTTVNLDVQYVIVTFLMKSAVDSNLSLL